MLQEIFMSRNLNIKSLIESLIVKVESLDYKSYLWRKFHKIKNW